jgi:hypothetical protein
VIRRAVILAIACSATLAACGGGDEDEDQVRALVGDFYAHGSGVCDNLTDRFVKESFAGDRKACERQARAAKTKTDYEIKSVEVDGDEAKVELEAGGEAGTLQAVKEDGDWLVDGIETRSAADTGGADGEPDDGAEPPREDPEEAVRTSVSAWFDSVRKRDEQAYCGFLTERFIESKIDRSDTPFSTCLRNARSSLEKIDLGAKDPGFEEVTVDGRTARVKLEDGSDIGLKFEGGLWKIDQTK